VSVVVPPPPRLISILFILFRSYSLAACHLYFFSVGFQTLLFSRSVSSVCLCRPFPRTHAHTHARSSNLIISSFSFHLNFSLFLSFSPCLSHTKNNHTQKTRMMILISFPLFFDGTIYSYRRRPPPPRPPRYLANKLIYSLLMPLRFVKPPPFTHTHILTCPQKVREASFPLYTAIVVLLLVLRASHTPTIIDTQASSHLCMNGKDQAGNNPPLLMMTPLSSLFSSTLCFMKAHAYIQSVVFTHTHTHNDACILPRSPYISFLFSFLSPSISK